jgi:hypothetical protein
MTDVPQTGSPTVYQCWSQAVQNLLGCQWQLFEVQCEVSLKMMERVIDLAAGGQTVTPARAAEKLRRLETLAAERARAGLAPPREIYELPFRELVDWAKFPEWARPSDPELFAGSAHEG